MGCAFRDVKRVEGMPTSPETWFQGGVGRNIAENLGRLGLRVGFVSLSETGRAEREIRARLKAAGIDWKARRVLGGIGYFEATLDGSGRLLRSTAQVPPLEMLDWRFLSRSMEWLRESRYIVLETGLRPDLLKTTIRKAEAWGVPVCGAMTRVGVCNSKPEILCGLSCLTLNQVEASQITGLPMRGLDDGAAAARDLLRMGIQTVALTMGPEGVITASRSGSVRHFPAAKAIVRDGTGAGDAFTAGLVAGLVGARPFRVAVNLGLRVAGKTVETFDNVRISACGSSLSKVLQHTRSPGVLGASAREAGN